MNADFWKDAPESYAEWSDVSLIIDTESYAGSFERELCAYCTGVHDGTSTAAALIANEYDGAPLEDLVGGDYDSYGSYRRAKIYPTPGWSSDENGTFYRVTPERPFLHNANLSVRIYFQREPSELELMEIKRRAHAFAASGYKGNRPLDDPYMSVYPFTITGFRLVRERTVSQSKKV